MGRTVFGHRALIWLAASLFAVVLLQSEVRGQTDTNEWQLLKRSILIPERGEVVGYGVVMGTNRFSVVPPPRWRVVTNPKDRTITLTPKDFTATVTIELRPLEAGTSGVNDPATVRRRMVEKYPEATIAREYKAPTGLGEGTALDLERAGKGRIKINVRHVAVAVDGLLVNFTLSAPTGRFDKFTFPFGALLTSFKRDSGPAAPPTPE